MGQLERYGLYVLCVVIVLILGVAIWGGDPAAVVTNYDREMDLALLEDDLAATNPPGFVELPGDEAAVLTPEDFFQPEVVDITEPVEPLAHLPVEQLPGVVAVSDSSVEASVIAAAAKQPGTHVLRSYKVKAADTMEKIARDVLHDERLVSRIRELNPNINPRRMQIGAVLMLPTDGGADSSTSVVSGLDSMREYEVEKGDTVSAISKAMYGTTRHATRILEANGISNPKRLRPGVLLRIPPLQ